MISSRVALASRVVGASEAPIIPELMDGYVAMGALATDKELQAAARGRRRGSHPLPIGVSPVWGKLWVCDGRVSSGHDPDG